MYAFFFRPLVLLSVFGMFLNDHYLKYRYPGWVTGKLSDFLGLFYVPLLLCVFLLLVLRGVLRKEVALTARLLVAAIVLTDVVFIAAKTTNVGNHVVLEFLNLFFESRLVRDISDLGALLASPLVYLYSRPFIKS